MRNIAIVNTCDWGSTGKIAKGLQNYLKSHGKNAFFCYGRGMKRDDAECYRFSSPFEVGIHYVASRLSGMLNANSTFATKRLVKKMRQHKIKEIYIINLHGYILNERIFLDYLVKDKVHVVYVMADESAFLGNCSYRAGCENYLDSCKDCERLKGLPKLFCPNASSKAFQIKKSAYERIKYITFVGPEFVMLAGKTSLLLEGKRLEIVDEAIDVNVNFPRDTYDLRKGLGIKDDQIVIGCVAPYSYSRKGVRYFVETAKMLENDDRFVFVQVGFDIKDRSFLPNNYIPIGYVGSQELLTEYYSLVDLFVFPSLHDTMPNACLEALACGTPLLCFNTSGMPFMADETVMTLVEARNVNQMVDVVLHTKKKDEETINKCRAYALKRYDNQKYFEKLLSIMDSMNNNQLEYDTI